MSKTMQPEVLAGAGLHLSPQKPFLPIFQQCSNREADLGAANCDSVAVEKKETNCCLGYLGQSLGSLHGYLAGTLLPCGLSGW